VAAISFAAIFVTDKLTFMSDCTKQFTANGWKSILPEGWTDRSMITLVRSINASGIAANIVVTREETSGQMTLEKYAESQKSAMLAELPQLQILDERSTTVDGHTAVQRLHRFAIDGAEIQQAQTFIAGENCVFVITGTAAIEDFNAIISAIRSFTENFRLTID
jgi:hypothetical protein